MKTSSSPKLSRRNFLTAAGGLTIGVSALALSPRLQEPIDGEKELQETEITVWVRLQPNGDLMIYSPASEMGQGSKTALPVIFAEEFDADWSKVRIEQSPIDPDTYGMPGFRGGKMMLNVGSFTVKRYFEPLRQAGAQARWVLLNSVSKKWQVPMQELSTEQGTVYHKNSKRSISYGEILAFLEVPTAIPEIPKAEMKKPSEFRLIGKVNTRHDIQEKANGAAQFAIDVQVPGMCYGLIERGNVHGAKATLLNEEAINKEEGLVGIVPMEYGIGIVAKSLPQALAIKKKLKIEWSGSHLSQNHSSQKAYLKYANIAGDSTNGRVLHEKGSFTKAKEQAVQLYQADYQNDYVYHAQMEPVNAIASVTEEGIEIWAGTQGPGFVKGAVASAMGLDESQVTFHQQYLGGGLGRRSLHDYIIEAAQLSKAVAQPVKLVWTREDDLQYGYYRPLSLQRLQATVDADGGLTGFSHTIIGDGSNLLASGARNAFYEIPNQYLALKTVKNGIRLKHWRSVGHGPNKFAIESMIDEVALGQGIDPFEFRKNLMKKYPRASATLEEAAKLAKWGSPVAKGRARGIAFGERSGSLATGICEISVDKESGKIRVHHFWAAVDAGIIVQPDNAIAQMEGGIIMGMSSVLSEQITIDHGKVQQSNFHNYPLLRMKDIPESIEVSLIPSEEAPQGMGETSLPLVGGAIANAFAALTGKRLRHMPFTPDRVKAALNS